MSTILCYGDSNTWGATPQPRRGDFGRFAADVRWPGVLRAHLGAGHTVIEEGLNGRTTCIEDPVEGYHKSGTAHLIVALESHQPLDLVIIMLGTNDLKARFAMQPVDVGFGMGKLAEIALRSPFGPNGTAPEVLLVAPAPFAKLSWFEEMFTGGTEKSRHLAAEIAINAREKGVHFFDAGSVISSSDNDGIHLEADAHATLGKALADQVRSILAKG
ncbi:lysophospholipase L1-like esterase [Kaistia hirudinis]|uniref:Lysophospholipase L1-like esterase n=1 Tax=Kaistia hirudinis TaxID=1293440 RepID=A0A840ATI6_9HYPH|nr:lysophospholipase L1-like esterase [Kaistia hirudinis]